MPILGVFGRAIEFFRSSYYQLLFVAFFQFIGQKEQNGENLLM